MTYIGHVKTIKIAEFKAHLSRELRRVRNGESITIKDRNTPIARVIPYDKDARIRARPPLKKLVLSDFGPLVDEDPLLYLLDERSKR